MNLHWHGYGLMFVVLQLSLISCCHNYNDFRIFVILIFVLLIGGFCCCAFFLLTDSRQRMYQKEQEKNRNRIHTIYGSKPVDDLKLEHPYKKHHQTVI